MSDRFLASRFAELLSLALLIWLRLNLKSTKPVLFSLDEINFGGTK